MNFGWKDSFNGEFEEDQCLKVVKIQNSCLCCRSLSYSIKLKVTDDGVTGERWKVNQPCDETEKGISIKELVKKIQNFLQGFKTNKYFEKKDHLTRLLAFWISGRQKEWLCLSGEVRNRLSEITIAPENKMTFKSVFENMFKGSDIFFCYSLGYQIWNKHNNTTELITKPSESSNLGVLWANNAEMILNDSPKIGYIYRERKTFFYHELLVVQTFHYYLIFDLVSNFKNDMQAIRVQVYPSCLGIDYWPDLSKYEVRTVFPIVRRIDVSELLKKVQKVKPDYSIFLYNCRFFVLQVFNWLYRSN